MGAAQERELQRITTQFGLSRDLLPFTTIETLIKPQLKEHAAYMQSLLVHKIDKIAQTQGKPISYSLAYAEMIHMLGFMQKYDSSQWNQANLAIYEESLHEVGQ